MAPTSPSPPSDSSGKSPPQKPAPAATPAVLRVLFRPRFLACGALLLALIVLQPTFIQLLPKLQKKPQYSFDPASVTISAPHPWVPPDLLQRVLKRAGYADQISLLDENLTPRIASVLVDEPWIDRVVRVSKSLKHGLVINVEYRTPVAMMETEAGIYPVDVYGVLLPPTDFAVADVDRFPLVVGISAIPHVLPGQRWDDPVVRDAANLASALFPKQDIDRYWRKWGITSIRPTATDNPSNILFQLDIRGGSRVIWGRTPGHPHPGEIPLAQKLSRLERYLGDTTSRDRPRGTFSLDITHWQTVNWEPLGSTQR